MLQTYSKKINIKNVRNITTTDSRISHTLRNIATTDSRISHTPLTTTDSKISHTACVHFTSVN